MAKQFNAAEIFYTAEENALNDFVFWQRCVRPHLHMLPQHEGMELHKQLIPKRRLNRCCIILSMWVQPHQ